MLREIRNRAGRNGRNGFTLIELLVVVAIIGIIAAILIPNMLNALQKAKQKKTVAEQRLVGTAMMAWLTDQSGAAAAGASQTQGETVNFAGDYTAIAIDDLRALLVPTYIQTVEEFDGWQNAYDYRINQANVGDFRVLGIRSFGRYGVEDTGTYTPGSFAVTDYNQDIVWTDGFFVRWPEGTNN